MRNWRLFFCHIPKTGGTSLRRAVEALVPPRHTVPDTEGLKQNRGRYPDMNAALAAATERAATIRFFRGHYHFSCRHALPGNFKTIVILREPIERNVSLFRHMIAHQGKSEDELRAHLCSGRSIGPDNHMTRFLAGTIRQSTNGSFSDSHLFAAPIDDPERAVEEAIAALDSCDYVGMTSNLRALQGPLRELTGRRRLSIGIANLSEGSPPSFSPQETAAFEKHNDLDLRLYNHLVESLRWQTS